MVGEGDKALRIYAKAKPATLDRLGTSPLFVLGMSLFDGGHFKESLQAFQKCASSDQKADPSSRLLGWVWQGHLLDVLNRRDEAVACYRQALQYCSADTDIRHDQYGIRITRAWVEKRLQSPFQRPDPKILELRTRINDLAWTGAGDQALLVFSAATNITRADSGLPWGKLGLCLYDGKHYSQALEVFKKDFTENPTSFSSLVWQGHMLDLLNQRENALSCYREALSHWNPDDWVRHDQYGIKIDRDWIQERIKTPFRRADSATPVSSQEFGRETGAEPELRFHIWGSVPFRSRLTSAPKNQRLLFCIRKDAKRIEEIGKEVKISSAEATEALSSLTKYDLVKATNDSRWIANFPIFTQAEILRANEIGIKYGRLEADLLRNQIPNLKQAYEQCQAAQYHPWAETSLIIVGALCADFCVSDRIRFKKEYFNERFLPPRHPDGQRWGYSGEEVLSSPLPFRKYEFCQNVTENPQGGVSRFGYYSLLDEQRQSPRASRKPALPARREDLAGFGYRGNRRGHKREIRPDFRGGSNSD